MKKITLARTRSGALWASLLAAQSSALAATVVPGTLINVDFDSTSGSHGRKPYPVTFNGDLTNPLDDASMAYQDADTAANDQWNGWEMNAAQPAAQVDSKGADTGVTVSWSGFTFGYTNYNNNKDTFTNGPNADGFYCAAAEGPGVVTIAGLDKTKTYDVAALGSGDSATFKIGTESQSIESWNSDSNAANWRVFSQVIPSSEGKIVLTVTSNGHNFGIGGVQITPSGTVLDTDKDGMPDTYEDANGLKKNDAADAALDADKDGLSNLTEYQKTTDPQKEDTDEDGLKDGVENGDGKWVDATRTGTDPLKKDSDGDGLPDGEEDFSSATGTDPNKPDTDGDGFSDSVELNSNTNPRDATSNPRLKVTGRLVNIDFDSTTGSSGPTDPVTFDGNLTQNSLTALSVPIEDSATATNDFWNGFMTLTGTEQPLMDSKNTATPYMLSWSGFGTLYTNWSNRVVGLRTNGPNGDGLMVQKATDTGTVILSHLDPAKIYDVAVIGGGSDNVIYTIGPDIQPVAGWNTSDKAANWVIFNNVLPDASGEVTIKVTSPGNQNFSIGGVQFTETGVVLDTDRDGMPDTYEDDHGLKKNDASDATKDADQDGLSNLTEFEKKTDPQKEDTDDDGLKDGIENGGGKWQDATHTGTDPLKADSDGDGLKDGEENFSLPTGTDPNKADTDVDGFNDLAEKTAVTNPRDPLSNPRIKVPGTLINVDFNGNSAGGGGFPTPITFDGNLTQDPITGPSVAFEDSDLVTNDFWNGWEGGDTQSTLADQPQSLKDSLGKDTNVTVTWNGFTFNYTNYNNGRFGNGRTNGPNADGFYGGAAATPNVIIGGLDPAKTYDVVALSSGDATKFTIDGDTQAIGTWNSSTNPANWAIFEDIKPDALGTILINPSTNGGNFGMAGFQIAFPASAPVATFQILRFMRSTSTGDITLTWESSANRAYTIVWNTDMGSVWAPVSGQSALPGQAGSMTRSFSTPSAGAKRLFFKVQAQ